MKSRSNRIEVILIAFITMLFLGWSGFFLYKTSFIAIDGQRYFCLFDDAMISMRYAWNFAHGQGLVWNAGEYVQGYTNLLMTLLMSLPNLLFEKRVASLAIQILGAGFIVVIAFLTRDIADRSIPKELDNHRGLIRMLAFVAAIGYYPLVYWSLMGMETGLLSLLLLIILSSAIRYTQTKDYRFINFASLASGFAFLTRNDSIIFSFLIFVYILWDDWDSKKKLADYKKFMPAIGLAAIFIMGQTIFQYLYYGEFLPNTYTLKMTGMSLGPRIQNGIGFVKPFLLAWSVVIAMAALGLFLNFKKSRFLMFIIFVSSVAYTVYVGGDPWPYWRMMAPTIPLLIVVFIHSSYEISLSFSNKGRLKGNYEQSKGFKTPNLIALSILIIALVFVIPNWPFRAELGLAERAFQIEANQANVSTALAITQITTEDASVGVFWAGALPYFSDNRRAIDFLGKSDKYIAGLVPDETGAIAWAGMNSVPGHNKYDLDYSIKQLKPTYVQMLGWGTQNVSSWARDNYRWVVYKVIGMFLDKNSPHVLWEKIQKEGKIVEGIP